MEKDQRRKNDDAIITVSRSPHQNEHQNQEGNRIKHQNTEKDKRKKNDDSSIMVSRSLHQNKK